jgi:quercetin dioxygenase-like cupin family protein
MGRADFNAKDAGARRRGGLAKRRKPCKMRDVAAAAAPVEEKGMGRIIDLDKAPSREVAAGVTEASLVGDSRELAASLLGVAPGATYHGEVPRGADQYLFLLAGEARLSGAGAAPAALAARSFAVIEEGKSFALTASGGEAARVLAVVVPPPGGGAGHAGFTGGLKAMAVAGLPVVDVPKEKKKRIYLASHDTVDSKRGHAMIVEYTGETVTRKHHHPNAESMFVMLDGRVRFLVDGREVVLGPGEAVHFPMNDSHALRSADNTALRFLEFHVPGAFVTSYDA